MTLKFISHPSIEKTKLNLNMNEKFTFRKVSVNEVERIIKKLPKIKATDGDIPLKILKE